MDIAKGKWQYKQKTDIRRLRAHSKESAVNKNCGTSLQHRKGTPSSTAREREREREINTGVPPNPVSLPPGMGNDSQKHRAQAHGLTHNKLAGY